MLIPFVVSLSNHEWNQLTHGFLKLIAHYSKYPYALIRIPYTMALLIIDSPHLKSETTKCNTTKIT
jgi:hypothetical protein